MSYILTDEQIVDAARNEVANKVARGLFTGFKPTTKDDQLNVDRLVANYSKWSKNALKCEKEITAMVMDEFQRILN
jgi:hypothetical protein